MTPNRPRITLDDIGATLACLAFILSLWALGYMLN